MGASLRQLDGHAGQPCAWFEFESRFFFRSQHFDQGRRQSATTIAKNISEPVLVLMAFSAGLISENIVTAVITFAAGTLGSATPAPPRD